MKLIVAVDKSWAIGKDGGLLTHLPGDLKYFKEKTTGKTVIMGRATLESLPGGKPLPNRTNIVLTRDKSYVKDGCTIVHSQEELMEEMKKYPEEDLMVIGGEQIYMMLMKKCDTLYITKMDEEFCGDKHIMNVDKMKRFKKVWESEVKEENGIRYTFNEYRKVEE